MRRNILLGLFAALGIRAVCWAADEPATPKQRYVMRPMSATNSSGIILTAVYVDGFTNRATTMPELNKLIASLPKGSSLSYFASYGQFNFQLGTNRFKRYQILKDLCASNHVNVQSILIPDF